MAGASPSAAASISRKISGDIAETAIDVAIAVAAWQAANIGKAGVKKASSSLAARNHQRKRIWQHGSGMAHRARR